MTELPSTDIATSSEQIASHTEQPSQPTADQLEKLRSVEAAKLLETWTLQRKNSEKLLDDILRKVGKVKQTLDTCCSRRFDSLVKKTAPKYASGWLRANVERRYTHGQYGTLEYRTLALCQHGSLIDWPQIGQDGKPQRKLLRRFSFYPALITETMRMAFVRVTKGQITYLREDVAKKSAQSIGGTLFKIAIRFPRRDTQCSNIIITLEHTSGGERCTLEILFDGEQFDLKRVAPSEQFLNKGYEALVTKELIEQPEELNKFLNSCFRPFRFSCLDSDCKDLEKYLCEGRYKVGMIEAAQTPFLILYKDDRLL